jgi:hypothetical protein
MHRRISWGSAPPRGLCPFQVDLTSTRLLFSENFKSTYIENITCSLMMFWVLADVINVINIVLIIH